jgi:hypothetical protein
MTDDREGDDLADWLSSQFGSSDDDKPDAAEPAAEPPSKPDKTADPEPVPSPAAPQPRSFTWGLTPPAASSEPSVSPAEPVAASLDSPELPVASEPPVLPKAFVAPEWPAAPVPPTDGHEPEPFDSSLAGPPSPEAEPPTMALPWESTGSQLLTPAAAGGSIAEPATELLSGFETVPADAAAESPVDALFGETQFRDYEAHPATSQNPFARAPEPVAPEQATAAQASMPARMRTQREPLPRSQKVLFWIAGSLAALLVLLGLFFLGTKLPRSAGAPAPMPTATKSATPTPIQTALARGPLVPGTYKWDRLLGGECLAPFTSPWEEKFTVVDCATPHLAQLVARGTFVEPTAAATDPAAPATPSVGAGQKASTYPGVAALQTQINVLCSAPTVINFAAAGAYKDIQFAASYPANEKQWADGGHNYYCFVTRSSGEPLAASVAVTPAA